MDRLGCSHAVHGTGVILGTHSAPCSDIACGEDTQEVNGAERTSARAFGANQSIRIHCKVRRFARWSFHHCPRGQCNHGSNVARWCFARWSGCVHFKSAPQDECSKNGAQGE